MAGFIFRIILIFLFYRADHLNTYFSYDFIGTIRLMAEDNGFNVDRHFYLSPDGVIDCIDTKPLKEKDKYKVLIEYLTVFLPQRYVEGLDPSCFKKLSELMAANEPKFNRLLADDSRQTFVNVLELLNKRVNQLLNLREGLPKTEDKLCEISVRLDELIDPSEDRKW